MRNGTNQAIREEKGMDLDKTSARIMPNMALTQICKMPELKMTFTRSA